MVTANDIKHKERQFEVVLVFARARAVFYRDDDQIRMYRLDSVMHLLVLLLLVDPHMSIEVA